MGNKPTKILPVPVNRALSKLGADIRDARRRRHIPTAVLAERASMSRWTLAKIEKGDPGVQLGNYAMVLFVLGLVHLLSDLMDVTKDKLGMALDEERLPRRIRSRKPKAPR